MLMFYIYTLCAKPVFFFLAMLKQQCVNFLVIGQSVYLYMWTKSSAWLHAFVRLHSVIWSWGKSAWIHHQPLCPPCSSIVWKCVVWSVWLCNLISSKIQKISLVRDRFFLVFVQTKSLPRLGSGSANGISVLWDYWSRLCPVSVLFTNSDITLCTQPYTHLHLRFLYPI